MYYTIYKTTNKINGKYYIGMHKTKDLNDDYIGSGKILQRAIKKHGEENFKKEILFIFSSEQEMIDKEVELITEDEIKNPMCYNLSVGGWGGNKITDPNHHTHSFDHYQMMGLKASENAKKFPERAKKKSELITKSLERRVASGEFKNRRRHPFAGKSHSDETKEKMRQAKINRCWRENNSQFGSFWITDGLNNKKLKANEEIPEHWYKGRTI
jgi:hypothetical protein